MAEFTEIGSHTRHIMNADILQDSYNLMPHHWFDDNDFISLAVYGRTFSHYNTA